MTYNSYRVVLLSAFKYRLYPNHEQEMRLNRSLLSLCELYNRLRTKKIQEYKLHKISLTRTDLRSITLQERRNDDDDITGLGSIYSQVVQNTADRVSTAFKNFFEGRARFPKNKQPRKYLSMTFPQSGFKINREKKGLYLSGLGYVRIFMHRPLLGKVKRLTIKREAGEWYAAFITERDSPAKQPVDTVTKERIRGADLGLTKFATLDNADSVEYPEFLRRSEDKIKLLQRRLRHKRKESRRWRQTCFSLAKLHLHVKRQREDFQNKLVHSIFKENDILVVEKLNVSGMLQNHSLAKSISDASFGRFIRKAVFKAQVLGKHLVAVDPWGTSQFCYNCFTWVPKDLSERNHECPNCGVNLPRDVNSALLIKRLGIHHSCPPSDRGLSPAEPKPLPSLREMASQGAEAGSLRFYSEEDVTLV